MTTTEELIKMANEPTVTVQGLPFPDGISLVRDKTDKHLIAFKIKDQVAYYESIKHLIPRMPQLTAFADHPTLGMVVFVPGVFAEDTDTIDTEYF